MTRILVILLFALAAFTCVSTTGCAWVAETLINAALGTPEIKDGRDQDRDGLTRRDIIARGEEQIIRDWEHERRTDQWNDYNERQQARKNPQPFSDPWQEFLDRNRD